MRETGKLLRNVGLQAAFLGVLLWACFGCSQGSLTDSQNEQLCEDRKGHTETEHHEAQSRHEGHGEVRSLSLEAIAALLCEHDVPAYQCASCRYEVGVVKVLPSLVKEDLHAGSGLVRTRLVEKSGIADSLTVTGEVNLNESAAVHISPRIPGIIESVNVELGADVREGDVLFNINSVELVKALTDYERSRALAVLAGKNVERERSLFERRISSEQDMIDAQMTHETHTRERDAARQALRVLDLTEEELASIDRGERGDRVGSLPVRAPMDGTIIEKRAVVGKLVEPGSDVMLLADLTTLWVWADIYEQDLSRLIQARSRGPIPVNVLVRAFPGRSFEGDIDYVGDTMEKQTRTVKVRATVENTDRLLRPGMFCEIRMRIDVREEVLAIPKAALLSDDGRDFVFSRWKEDYYIRRPVKKGREFSDRVEIIDNLAPGDTIVTEGAFLLKSDILRQKMGAGCAD